MNDVKKYILYVVLFGIATSIVAACVDLSAGLAVGLITVLGSMFALFVYLILDII